MSDLYNLSAIFEGLNGLLGWKPFLLMVLGVIASSCFAAVPGIGALILLSMMIPYAMELDPYSCIALLLGIGVVSNTANTFASVLIAVPGSAGSQATILDGHPMARRGEAQRAFGAAYTASALGGIFGGFVFLASLPIMKPLVYAFGSPEFMMLVLWGLSAIGILSGSTPVKGLMAAALGLGLSLVGTDSRTGIERFTFDDYYLWDGIHLVLIALGVFAVPELVDLSVRRTAISETGKLGTGLWRGVKDVFQNWWLVIRCSTVGVWVGMLPGLGSSVADWFAYAHAAQTEKDPEKFGTGDVRGVIAPESSNNAKEGGALIPTTVFGVPGSTSYALMLVAFISVGIQPGERMLGDQLPYLYAMLWVLVFANLLATGLSMGFSGLFAKISILPFYIVVPMTLVLCTVAAFSASYAYADLLVFGLFSVVGVFMKTYGWPRPPLLVAVVLGPQLQNYLWLTVERYEWSEWFSRPGVLVLLGIIVLTVLMPIYRKYRKGLKAMHYDVAASGSQPRVGGDVVIVAIYMGLCAFAIYSAQAWPPKASLPVYAFAGAGLLLGATQFALDVILLRALPPRGAPTLEDRTRLLRYGQAALWILGLGASIVALGFQVSFFLFPLLYSRAHGASWKVGLLLGVLAEAMLIGLFDTIIHIVWPQSLLSRLVPWLV